MKKFLPIALMFVIFTARDEQTGSCIRKGNCKDVRVEQSITERI